MLLLSRKHSALSHHPAGSFGRERRKQRRMILFFCKFFELAYGSYATSIGSDTPGTGEGLARG